MPGGIYCCAYGCGNNQKHHNNKSFFALPTDPEKLAVWLSLIQREDLLETSKGGKLNQRVCCDHFGEEHYRFIKKLNQNAIPHLNIPVSTQKEPEPDPSKHESLKDSQDNPTQSSREMKDSCSQTTFNELQCTYKAQPHLNIPVSFQKEPEDDPSTSKHESLLDSQDKPTQSLTREMKDSCNQTTFKEVQCTSTAHTQLFLSTNMPRKRSLKMELTIAKKKLKLSEKTHHPKAAADTVVTMSTFLKLCDRLLDEKMSNIVKCHVSMVDKFKSNRNTMDFKLIALQKYFRSPHAYRFLQQLYNFPSIRTLQSMQIPIPTGIDNFFFNVLKQKTSQMDDNEKICTICIDAMSLTPHLGYEAGEDKIHGLHEIDNVVRSSPATKAVVVMAHGIFVKWKQPIAYALTADCKNYPELLLWFDKVIRALLGIGLNIRAIVSDLSADFLNASRARNISQEKTWFQIDGKKIYYIFDAPHLLKSARNSLINYDFHFGDKIAKWQHIEQAYEKDCVRDLKLMPKLTEKHIKPNTADKMQLKYVTQVFSRTVASAMSIYAVITLIDKGAKDTTEFILFLNILFDTLNSASVHTDNVYRRAYKGKEEQKQFLVKALELLKSLELKRSYKKSENKNFITGLVITVQSIMSLFEDLKNDGHDFLFTRNLNKDCLENVFDQIRQQGGNCIKPTAIQFNTAFRKLFLLDTMKCTKVHDCEDDLIKSYLIQN